MTKSYVSCHSSPQTHLFYLVFFPFFFFSSFQRSPHFKRRRKPYLKILWTKVSVSCRPCLRVFSSEFLTVSPQQTPRSLLYKHTHRHKKNKPHPSVFLFSNGFSLWHSQTLRDVCRVIVCVCSSFSHHSHFPSNRQAEKHMALSFFFWLIYLCLSSVFVYIFLKFSVALSHFAKLSRPSPDMSKMPFQFNCSKCKKRRRR